MRKLGLLLLLSVPACNCYDAAYDEYCRNSPRCDGGSAGGASAGGGSAGGGSVGGGEATGGGSVGGGEATGGGTAGGGVAGGGEATGGGAATGGGSASMPVGLRLNVATAFDARVCLLGSVIAIDANGDPAAVPAVTTVTLGNGGNLVAYYAASDNDCAGAKILTAAILAGADSASFRYRGEQFGADTLSATAGALASANLGVTATARAIVDQMSQYTTSSGCSSLARIRAVKNQNDNEAVTAHASSTFTVTTGGSSTVGWGDGVNCNNVSSFTVTLPAGSEAATLSAGGRGSPVCGDANTITISALALSPGLSIDTAKRNATVRYEGSPLGGPCATNSDCCASRTCTGATPSCQ